MSLEVVGSKIIYQGKVFEVRQEQVRFPDGRIAQMDIVDHHAAVTMVPVDKEGQIWFIRQYRHPAGRELLELPAGVVESGESPRETAQREIREEIGMAARRLEEIGGFFLAPGYSTEYMHIFLATELHPDPLQADEGERIRVEKIASSHAIALAETGLLQDSKSLIGMFWARPYLIKMGFVKPGV